MKILIDARMYGLEYAGIGRYEVNLIQWLSRLDHKNDYAILLRKKYYENLSLNKNWHKIKADYKHYSISEQLLLPKLISAFKPDLVHFLHFNIPLLYNGKYMVTIHDITMHKQSTKATTLPLPLYYLKRLPYKIVFRSAVKNSLKIIVPTSFVKKEITDYYHITPNKVQVIYEGVDKLLKLSADKVILEKYKIQGKYFLYVGNVYPHKNIERLIHAVKELNEKDHIKVKLVIVCSRNVFSSRLEQYIYSNKAEDFVKILGFVPDSDLPVIYKEALAFVYPTLAEGFGLPGLEAMSAGTLVTASNIPVLQEIYKNNAFYFDPLDISSMESVLLRILNMNQVKRKLLINQAKAFLDRYSWEKMAKETLQAYENSYHL